MTRLRGWAMVFLVGLAVFALSACSLPEDELTTILPLEEIVELLAPAEEEGRPDPDPAEDDGLQIAEAGTGNPLPEQGFLALPEEAVEPTSPANQVEEPDAELPAAYAAYAQVIQEHILLTPAAEVWRTAQYSAGNLYDVTGNGQEELLLYYHEGEAAHFEVWTYALEEAQLIGSDQLFQLAGSTEGGLSLVEVGEARYLCAWYDQQEAADPPAGTVSYTLYQLADQSLTVEEIYRHLYGPVAEGEMPTYSVPEADPATLHIYLHNDTQITAEAFAQLQPAFENPLVQLVETPYTPPPGADGPQGLLFTDLLDLLQGK